MYPGTVHFQKTEGAPVLLRWEPPLGTVGVIIYQSTAQVRPEDTERFYAGEFSRVMKRVRLGPAVRALVDDGAPAPAWTLIQGIDRSGDLVEVSFSAEVIDDLTLVPEGARHVRDRRSHSPLDAPPEMVFRDDDPKARLSVRAMAAALEDQQ